jgi:hypothetical protein
MHYTPMYSRRPIPAIGPKKEKAKSQYSVYHVTAIGKPIPAINRSPFVQFQVLMQMNRQSIWAIGQDFFCHIVYLYAMSI